MKITPGMYRAFTMVALPLASLYLMWRSRKQPAYRDFWDERFAWSSYPPKGEKPRVWLHAVSVGETNAAKPLLEAMLKAWPECDVLLTHMTPTGREAGRALVDLAPERIHQCYLPYDAPYAVERFFRQTRPTMGVIMETEVWPNVMREAARLGIPMVLANARESEKSKAKAEQVIDVMRPAFASFSAVLAQSDEDAERLASLGAPNITVCGSIKFDLKPDASQRAAARAWKSEVTRPVALLASTRVGEEVRFAKAIAAQKDFTRRALVLAVPRHPQRFDEAAAAFEAEGLRVVRRSKLRDAASIPADADVLLGDSMGEMSFYCALADMAAMGGSFEPFGSQNVIEPAMAGTALVVGPSVFNFDKIVRDGVADGAMLQVETPEAAIAQFTRWLDDPEARRAAGGRAAQFAEHWSGATARMMTLLEEVWRTARKNESLMS